MTATYKRGQRIEKYEPLTAEQQKLVEENAYIIYAVFDKLKVSPNIGIDVDDVYGRCAIALCRAAQLYESKKGEMSFFNFAFTYCKWAVLHCRDRATRDWDNTCSFDFDYNDDDNDRFTVEDKLATSCDDMNDVIVVKLYKDLLKNETDVNQRIIHNIVCGESASNVAREFGLSRQRVSQIFNRFAKRARAAWLGEK